MFGALPKCANQVPTGSIALGEGGGQFREQLGQRVTVLQHLNEYFRPRLHQRTRNFFPAALRRQRRQLAGARQLAHQLKRLVGDTETQFGIARGEARHAQNTQRIFGESGGNVAQ